jgi:hypothetical protein
MMHNFLNWEICMLVIYVNSQRNCRSGEKGREQLPTPPWRQFPALLEFRIFSIVPWWLINGKAVL